MTTNHPLISIIIPSYNRAAILSETLDSFIAQSYVNWECIIVDDGSTDTTDEIVKTYTEKDSRFRYYKRPETRPKGANSCRNIGFEKAKGEFVNWFDSDDIAHSDFLKEKLKPLENDLSLDFCCCISSTFKENIDTTIKIEKPKILNSKNYIEDYLLRGFYFYTPSPLWRKRFLDNKVLFDELLHRSQERDFHFRMLTYGPNFKYLDKVLFYVRIGADSITSNAKSSLTSQLSVFRYFDKVFNTIQTNKKITPRRQLLEYVFYRQAVNYYNLNQLEKNISGRIKIFKSYRHSLFSYVNELEGFSGLKIRLHIGILMVLVFNKGYSYFYYPKYNYRIKNG